MPGFNLSPLTCKTFFKFWAVEAFGKNKVRLSKKDRAIAQVCSVLFGAVTLGMGTWICKKCLHDRKIIRQQSSFNISPQNVNAPRPNPTANGRERIVSAIQNNDALIRFLHEANQEGFTKFREKYREVKAVMAQEGITNPILEKYASFHTRPEFHDITIQTALACDVLDTRDLSSLKNWPERIVKAGSGLPYGRQLAYKVFEIVVNNCEAKDIPVLFPHFESMAYGTNAVTQWLNHEDKEKWKAALPCLWKLTYQGFLDFFMTPPSGARLLVRSLLTKEKFQMAFEDLLIYKYDLTNSPLPKELFYVNEADLIQLSLPKRMEIAKNIFWNKCLQILNDLNSINFRTDVIKKVVSSQSLFFTISRELLKNLLEKSESTTLAMHEEGNHSNLTIIPDEPLLNFVLPNIEDEKTLIALCSASRKHYHRFTPLVKEAIKNSLQGLIPKIEKFNSDDQDFAKIVALLDSFLKQEKIFFLSLEDCFQIKNLFEMLVFERIIESLPGIWDDF